MNSLELLLVAWLVPWDRMPEAPALRCFDELHPFAYAFNPRGEVVLAHPELLARALRERSEATRIVPVVVNDVVAGSGKPAALKSPELLRRILGEPEAMERHVQELLRIASAPEFSGLEIDYERIPEPLWGRFVEFIARLGAELRRQGKTLVVDVEAGSLRKGREAQRYWPQLAQSADRLQLMCYYERGEWSLVPGPGASLEYAKDAARKALSLVGPERLSVALSLAGTEYKTGASLRGRVRRLHYREVRETLLRTGALPRWDARFASPFITYRDDDGNRELWFEDERSLREKIESLRKEGVRSIGLWYLGGTHPDLSAAGLCAVR